MNLLDREVTIRQCKIYTFLCSLHRDSSERGTTQSSRGEIPLPLDFYFLRLSYLLFNSFNYVINVLDYSPSKYTLQRYFLFFLRLSKRLFRLLQFSLVVSKVSNQTLKTSSISLHTSFTKFVSLCTWYRSPFQCLTIWLVIESLLSRHLFN